MANAAGTTGGLQAGARLVEPAAPIGGPMAPANARTALNALRGVVLVMGAVLAFALADVVTKHLTMRYDVSLVLAGRYAVNLGLLVAFLAPRHGWGW